MNTNEYLSVLVSIIIGLGLSHLLGSVGKLLSRRTRVRTYAPTVAVAVMPFLAHVQFWWGSFEFGERIANNFFAFLVFLLTPILLYLLAVLALPELDHDDSGVVSLRDHYYEARPWLFGLTAMIPLATAVRNAGFQGAPCGTRTARSSSRSSSSRSWAPLRPASACTACCRSR